MKWLLWFDLPLLLGFAAAIVLYGWAWDAWHVIGMAMAEALRHSTSDWHSIPLRRTMLPFLR